MGAASRDVAARTARVVELFPRLPADLVSLASGVNGLGELAPSDRSNVLDAMFPPLGRLRHGDAWDPTERDAAPDPVEPNPLALRGVQVEIRLRDPTDGESITFRGTVITATEHGNLTLDCGHADPRLDDLSYDGPCDDYTPNDVTVPAQWVAELTYIGKNHMTRANVEAWADRFIPPPERGRFDPVPASSLLDDPRPEWIVKGVIPGSRSLVVVFGQPGAAKSFFMLDLCLSITTGKPWRNLKTRRGRVVYVCAEGRAGFRDRIAAAISEGRDVSNLEVVGAPLNLLAETDSAELITSLGLADLVVIDSFAAATPGANENTSEDMGAALGVCQRIQESTEGTVVLIHHAGKDQTKGARGWSGIKAATDAEIEVTRTGECREARVTKMRDGADGARFSFTLKPVSLGTDEDGEPIVSCVVHHMDGVVDRPKAPKGRTQRTVFTAVEKLTKGVGHASVDAVIDEAKSHIAHDPAKRDVRRQSITRALTDLHEAGLLRLADNRVEIVRE